jgi:hypothetical protein
MTQSCIRRRCFLSANESVQVLYCLFNYICIFIRTPINKRRKVGIPLTGLTLPHCCACTWISNVLGQSCACTRISNVLCHLCLHQDFQCLRSVLCLHLDFQCLRSFLCLHLDFQCLRSVLCSVS